MYHVGCMTFHRVPGPENLDMIRGQKMHIKKRSSQLLGGMALDEKRGKLFMARTVRRISGTYKKRHTYYRNRKLRRPD